MGVPQNGWIIVENPIKDGDFPVRYVSLPEGMRGVHMGYEWEIYMGYNLGWTLAYINIHYPAFISSDLWTEMNVDQRISWNIHGYELQ